MYSGLCFLKRLLYRKANLKLTIERLRIQKKKRSNLADNEKRAVADLLAKDRIDDARIKCEGILKEDATCEAYEILGISCRNQKTPPPVACVGFFVLCVMRVFGLTRIQL